MSWNRVYSLMRSVVKRGAYLNPCGPSSPTYSCARRTKQRQRSCQNLHRYGPATTAPCYCEYSVPNLREWFNWTLRFVFSLPNVKGMRMYIYEHLFFKILDGRWSPYLHVFYLDSHDWRAQYINFCNSISDTQWTEMKLPREIFLSIGDIACGAGFMYEKLTCGDSHPLSSIPASLKNS